MWRSVSLGFGLCLACVSAQAQIVARPKTPELRGAYENDPTGMRAELGREYAPVGIRAGSFVIYPGISSRTEFTDNLYATRTNKISDWTEFLRPSLNVLSNWSRHALDFGANLTQSFHAKTDAEDSTDWEVSASGRFDSTRNGNLQAGVVRARRTEPRGSGTSLANAAEPTKYNDFSTRISVENTFSRLTLLLRVEFQQLAFEAVRLFSGGTASNSERDRQNRVATLRAGFDISPNTNIFVGSTFNRVVYDQRPPAVPQDSGSHGFNVGLGAEFRRGSPLYGTVFAGYRQQTYNSGAPDITGVAYNLDLNWEISGLTTFRLAGASTITESVYAGSFGTVNESVGLGVTHFLLRQLRFTLDGRYVRDRFSGTGRKDDGWDASFDATYLINRNFSLGLSYEFQSRDSTDSIFDFTQHIASATLAAKF